MKKVRDFFNSAATLSIAIVIVKVLGALYKVPLSYMVGEVGLGYFNIAYSVFSFFFLLMNSGLPKALTITVSSSGKMGNREAGYILYRRVLFVVALLSLGISMVLFFGSDCIAIALGNRGANFAIKMISPAILFVSIGGVARGYLNAYLKLGWIAGSQIFEAVIKLLCGIGFAYLGARFSLATPTICALAISGVTLGSLISMSVLLFACKKLKPNEKSGQCCMFHQAINADFKRNLIPLGISSLAISLSAAIDTMTIINGLSAIGFSESEATAIYGNYATLALPMVALVTSVVAPLCNEMMPRLASISHAGRDKENCEILRRYVLIALATTIPLALAFTMYSFEITDLLYPSNQASRAADMLSLLAPTILLQTVFNLLITFLESTGRPILASILSFLYLGVKFVLNIALISNPNISANGASISTSMSYLILCCIIYLIIGKDFRRIDKSLNEFGILIAALVSFVPPYTLIYSTNLLGNGFNSAFLAGAIGMISYICLTMSNIDMRRIIFTK